MLCYINNINKKNIHKINLYINGYIALELKILF